jgi:hypothetical protein
MSIFIPNSNSASFGRYREGGDSRVGYDTGTNSRPGWGLPYSVNWVSLGTGSVAARSQVGRFSGFSRASLIRVGNQVTGRVSIVSTRLRKSGKAGLQLG